MKYTIKKWRGWCPHWVVGMTGSPGVIGFSSFHEAVEHVKWALTARGDDLCKQGDHYFEHGSCTACGSPEPK